MKLKFISKIVFIFVLIAAPQAQATLISYGDNASWSANATNISTIDFNNHTAIEYVGSSVTDSGVTFTGNALYYQGNNTYAGAQWIGEKWFSFERGGSYSMIFDNAITALSFDFADYYDADMTLELLLNNGDSLTVNQGGVNTLGNVSFITTSSFTQVLLIATDTQGDFFGIDNLQFGTNSASDIPEPSVLALLTLGLISFASRRNKTK